MKEKFLMLAGCIGLLTGCLPQSAYVGGFPGNCCTSTVACANGCANMCRCPPCDNFPPVPTEYCEDFILGDP